MFLIIVVAIVTVASNVALDMFYNFFVLRRILARSMSEAYFYLDTHGKGYYRAPTEQALDEEQRVRFTASLLYHAGLLCLAFSFTVLASAFSVIAKAIGIAITISVAIAAFVTLKIESSSGCEIYRLVSSDEADARLRFNCLVTNEDYEVLSELWPRKGGFNHDDFYIIYRFFGLCYFTALSDHLEVIVLGTDVKATEEAKS